jgi:DNA segregation ATPase FtsK/SpoIIIE-like protein
VIDTGGAEKLLGSGDMLFYRDGSIQRLQAVFTGADDFASISSART